MLLAPQYNGVNLPIHGPETSVVYYPWALRNNIQNESIIRRMRVSAPLRYTGKLDKFLMRTDEELEKVAELCGAEVVPHEWGLYQTRNPNARSYKESTPLRLRLLGIPKGHLLVANVEFIANANTCEPDDPNSRSITKGLQAYYGQAGLKLADMDVRQFVALDKLGPATLVDIEPVWSS
jgi:hypothetical protein